MDGKKKTAALERGGNLSNDQVAAAGSPYNEKSSQRLLAVVEKEAIAAIKYATARFPYLSRVGMERDLFDPYALDFSLCGVMTALAFLRQFPKQSTSQYRSDWLSDKAEKWGGDCAVAVGEMCVAAAYLHLPINSDDGPNAIIGVNVTPGPRRLH